MIWYELTYGSVKKKTLCLNCTQQMKYQPLAQLGIPTLDCATAVWSLGDH